MDVCGGDTNIQSIVRTILSSPSSQQELQLQSGICLGGDLALVTHFLVAQLESACNAEKGNGYSLQYSCLENPMGRGS